MTKEEWLTSKVTIEKSRRTYAHFDRRTDIGEKRDYISNPANIAQHGFYPFIHYKQIQIKFGKAKGKKIKERDICYAAHIDRCIYQYYSFLLNELYNKRTYEDGISQVAIAYRTNLHQNNIHFAKRAITFIRANEPCCIMIGDFTGFFDHLDHKYLKQQWCSLIGEAQLPADHYKVFRSLTQYNTWELADLLELNQLKDTQAGRMELNVKQRVLTTEEYKRYSNRSHIKKNPNQFGIPQGSPISGLLANVYMLDVDKKVHNLVTSFGGLYMRYSDDFIIVLPDTETKAIHVLKQIADIFNETIGVTLEPSKTQYFRFDGKALKNNGSLFGVPVDAQKRFINFLGFTFDGNKVSIRTKTTAKYYYRMYKKAKTITKRRWYTPRGKHISAKNLYGLYSVRGARGCWVKGRGGKRTWHTGNYLTYVKRAEREFGKNESISRDTKRHMQKIRKALKCTPKD